MTVTSVSFVSDPPARRGPGREALTYGQAAIVEQLARGLNTRQTAERLGITVLTVRAQIHFIHKRLGFTHRGELILWAVEQGFGSRTSPR